MNKYRFSANILILLISVTLLACTSYAGLGDDDLKVLQDKNFKTEPGKKLKISGSSGDILVTSWDKSEVQVTVFGNEKARDKVDLNFSQGTDLIEVTAKREGFLLGWSGISLRFEVKVPKKYHNNLVTSGGDIRFAGVEGDNVLKTSGGDISIKETRGKLEVSTSGGDINFETSSGKLTMSTSGGNITGKDFAGTIDVSTSGGDIKLNGNNASIKAETSGGDILLNYDGENKGIELATSGGDIRISLPQNFGASAYLNTSGGNVECLLKTNNVKKLSSSRFEGDINNGGSKLIAKTSGGSIEVKSK